jgi:hypothetical protein
LNHRKTPNTEIHTHLNILLVSARGINLAETKPISPRKREMGAERFLPLDVRRMDGQDRNLWDVVMDQ